MMDEPGFLIDLEGDVPFEALYELVAGCYVSCLMDLRQGFFPNGDDVSSYRTLLSRLSATYPEDWRKTKNKILLVDWFRGFLDMVERVDLLPAGLGSTLECVDLLDLLLGREYPGLFGSGVRPEKEKIVALDPD